jgi:hypothetical protein
VSGSAPRRVAVRPLILLGCAVAYALVAADTTPFTTPADVLTGLPIAAMAVLVLIRWPARTTPLRLAAPEIAHPYRPWVVVWAAITVWELFNYLVHGSRADHPTFSSMTDAFDRFYLLKTLLFLGWLSLGWMIVCRGSRAASVAAPGPGAGRS